MTDAPVDDAARPDARGLRVALVLLAAGAGLLFVGYAGTWASAVVAQPGLPTLAVSLTGREVQPAGAAAAVLALAAIPGLVATRRVGRAVAGVLLAVAGLLASGAALAFGLGSRDAALRLVSDKAGVDVDVDLAVSAWWAAAAVGGLLLVVSGALAVVRGGRWPALGRRYERPAAMTAPATPAAGTRGPGAEDAGDSYWDQLDRGVDPTADPATGGGADPAADGATDHDTPAADPAQVARVDAPADTMAATDAQEDPR